ncbi:MAG: glycosyltransferase [Dorea sp.]|nr:glycosyltransferase [Dorea sp.]
MNTYITRINGLSFEDSRQYRQYMVAEAAIQLGCREMGIYCYDWKNEPEESLNSRMDGIIAGINAGDLVICQFPTGNGIRYERSLVNHLKMYRSRVAIFVQEDNLQRIREAIGLYDQAEVLIVPSVSMRRFLLDNGIRKNMKFVIQDMWDDTDEMGAFHTDRKTDRLSLELIQGKFGAVWYQDENGHRSMEYNISFTIAEYLAAGIPVAVPIGIANQTLLENNGVALIAESLEEAVTTIEKMEEREYHEYVCSAERFAPALRKGYYTKKCLIETMLSFYRRDAGRISIPVKDYRLGECIFDFIVLQDSYGGNLALSWSFHGEADGFLIYSTAGELICRTENIHQHYFLIKKKTDRKRADEEGFIVKAYVETRKGRLIVAESETVFRQKSQFINPTVSLIIPAYNAENFIIRSMDNAVAQSFSDLEIIAVDDGSQDRTAEILDWYGDRYSNVTVIHQENGYVSGARNAGIICSKGKYICFLDSDDMVRPDMVERLYNSIMKNDCDVAVASAYQITGRGYEILLEYPMEEDVAVPTEEFFKKYYLKECGYGTIVVCKLYRASLVKNHLFPRLSYEDEAWTPIILSYADRICYLNGLFYEYDRVIYDNSIVHKRTTKSKKELETDAREANRYFLINGNPQRIELLKELAGKHGQDWKKLIQASN